MKYVVVDFEMNPLAKIYLDKRSICANEIIQIGAVLLDENYYEIGSFMTLVKPQLNMVIEKKIVKLTGISTQMVQQAPAFETAVDMFFKWCASIDDEIEICQWSDSDYAQLSHEMQLKEYIMTDMEGKFMMTPWCDFQKEYDEKLGVDRCISLSTAMMYAGEDFKGKVHDALYDARNTGTLVRIVRTPSLCEKSVEKVKKIFKSEPVTSSLGEMFDFSAFVVMA